MEFYGQFDPPVDQFIFERYFPDLDIKGVFVECGAFDGQTECSCRFFEETVGWKGYNLEPVPWIYEQLVANRPSSTNLNLGLSNKTSSLVFQSVVHPKFGRDTTIGAIQHSPEFKQALINDGCTFEEITIDVISWDDLIAREKIKHVDLLVLDVEGHELAVLSAMKGSAVLPDVMCVEFGHIGFSVLRSIMADLGYDYDISSHANAFFLRRDFLPLFSLRKTAAQAASIKSELQRLDTMITELQRLDVTSIELEQQLQASQREIQHLRARENDLVRHVALIENSKSWRFIRAVRKWLPFGRRS